MKFSSWRIVVIKISQRVRIRILFNYPMMMRYQMGKPDFKVSEKYPDAFKGLDVNNEKLIAIPNYSQVVLNYVYTKNNEKMVAGTVTDLGIGMLSTLDTEVKSEKIKAFMAVQIAEQLIEKTEMVQLKNP